MRAVPDSSHYSSSYAGTWRIHSFAHQIEAALNLKPHRVLEIGVGAGMVAAALGAVGIEVVTLDIERTLKPSVIGSVTAIPLSNKCIDVCLCCQVLEHLPFDLFEISLRELHRVAKTGLILSLPDTTREYFVSAQLPITHRKHFSLTIPQICRKEVNRNYFLQTGHFWEVGYRGTTLKDVIERINAAEWQITRSWRVPQMTWHRFFDLRPL